MSKSTFEGSLQRYPTQEGYTSNPANGCFLSQSQGHSIQGTHLQNA